MVCVWEGGERGCRCNWGRGICEKTPLPETACCCALQHLCAASRSLPPSPPQVDCCIRSLSQGVSATHIIDGRQAHSLLMELLTDEGVGTMITG